MADLLTASNWASAANRDKETTECLRTLKRVASNMSSSSESDDAECLQALQRIAAGHCGNDDPDL